MTLAETKRRSAAIAYLKHMGWRPGDRFGLHSVVQLMIGFAAQEEKRRLTTPTLSGKTNKQRDDIEKRRPPAPNKGQH